MVHWEFCSTFYLGIKGDDINVSVKSLCFALKGVTRYSKKLFQSEYIQFSAHHWNWNQWDLLNNFFFFF